MFSYDKKENMLTIGKLRRKKPNTVYEKADVYESYQMYLKYGLKKDIEEVLFPKLNEAVESNLSISGFECRLDPTSYDGNINYIANVKLSSWAARDVAKPFCIFKIPYMDEYGVVYREKKQYAIIRELVQDDDITYRAGELKIVTKLGCFINLKAGSECPKMMYRKKGYNALNMMFALAQSEGVNCRALYDKMVSLEICNAANKLGIDATIEYGKDSIELEPFLRALKQEAYSLEVVRDRINKTVSLNRALGHVLSRAITLKNGEVIPSETLVTSNVLRKIKYSRINEIYVKDIPNMTGYVIGEIVELPYLRKGTEIVDVLRGLRPELNGKYLANDLDLRKDPIILYPGTPVTHELLEALFYNGYKMVDLKRKESSNVVTHVPLELTIMGNRHFKKNEIGLGDSNEYVYVNEDGEIEEPKKFMTSYDLAAIIMLFGSLEKGDDHGVIANLDLGLRKKVDLPMESFHKAFEKASTEFVRRIKNKFDSACKDPSMRAFMNPDEMEAMFFRLSKIWWRVLYVDMKLIKNIDMENPVSFYSSFEKVNAIVSDKNAITAAQHSISMGHYGRLCPYESPAGKYMGIVSNKAVGCKIENHKMKTAYYRVKHIGNKSFIVFDKVWMTVEEEEEYRIGDIMSLDFDQDTGLINSSGRVLARIPNKNSSEKTTVGYVDIKFLDFVNVSSNQTDGDAATTIPFQGADDGARVSFEIGMAKQAKGLVNPEVPIVMTSGFVDIPRKSPYYMIQAEYDGVVLEARTGYIVMQYDGFDEPKTYKFDMKQFQGKAVVIRRLQCQTGQVVKAGDILVDSNFIKDGYLATGVNALICFCNKGFNYEDGIFGSQNLMTKFTSYGAATEETPIAKTYKRNVVDNVNKFRYNKPGSYLYSIRHLTGGHVDPTVARAKKLKGFVIDVKIRQDEFSKRECGVAASSISLDAVNEGDKFANRHGNKGVAPILQKNSLMPRLKNGEIFDLAYNPEGVSSRMNIGQILEANLGLCGYILDVRMFSDSFDGATVPEIRLLLSYTWHLANDDDYEAVFRDPRFAVLGDDFHEHCRGRIEYIRNWKDSFNEDGTAYVFNPKTGKFFEQPMLIGVNYVYKLIHMVAKKEHARAGFCSEPYIPKLSSPTHGSSNDGGQRYGYMEIDGLMAYGATHFAHELLNERGDNPVARNNLTAGALHTGDAYMLDESTAIRRSTEYFVNIMEALGVVFDFEGELPNNTKEECKRRVVYKSKALIVADGNATKENKTVGMSAQDVSDALGKA